MAEKEEKYYWLKLKRDFFKRHDIRIVEKMPNGKDYILFYLKLLLESIDHEGTLRFSDTIPYNEQMLSIVTDTNIDIVKSAMKLFIELNMMQIFDDQTIYMTEMEKMIGSETKWAKIKREQRKLDNVQQLSNNCPIEKDKDKEKEIEKDKELDNITTTTHTHEDDVDETLKAQYVSIGDGSAYLFISDAQILALVNTYNEETLGYYLHKMCELNARGTKRGCSDYEYIIRLIEEDKKVRKK